MLKSSIFSYYISENRKNIPELQKEYTFGKYKICTDSETPFLYASNSNCECAVFGLAVDVLSGESENIPAVILESCKSITEVVEHEKRLGGKYILLCKDSTGLYILGDATGSIPVFYGTEGEFVCSSNYEYVVSEKKCVPDKELSEIRQSGDISQAMPYDVTPCREIKQLIPNHYLCAEDKKAVRFVNCNEKQKTVSVEQATEKVLPMIEKLAEFYCKKFKIYCPITSGRDSRVVLAFLMKTGADFFCYTIKHPHHTDSTQDIVISKELCQKHGLAYKLVEDVTVSKELDDKIASILGKDNYSKTTLRIAATVNEYFGDGAIINGDIIGQVGKCSLHRDIPKIFATPSYFRCKLHNYSCGAKKQLKAWLSEIKSSGEKVNTFDLFSVENRMGRWAAQTSLVYNSLGLPNINIFNSRSIIYVWSSVKRAERKRSLLHLELIEKVAPTLLETPFEKDESFIVKLSKSTGIAYLFSSYAKYFIEKTRFKLKKERNFQ